MSNFMSNADALQVFGPYAEGIKKATPVEIDYEDWIELPQEERENGNYIVTNYPGGEPQSGGHIIENDSSELPQRDTLKFEGFSTYDDDTNEKTVVKNPMFVGTIAEWEALSAAEKAKYTLVNFTDDGETGSEENYYTDEVRTNKRWIDGKPIYRKVYSFTTAAGSSGTSTYIPSGVSDMGHVISMGGYVDVNSGGRLYQMPIQWVHSSGIFVGVFYDYTLKSFTLSTGRNVENNMPAVLIVEYTKTTD